MFTDDKNEAPNGRASCPRLHKGRAGTRTWVSSSTDRDNILPLLFPQGLCPPHFLHGRASSYPGSDILRSYGTKRANFLTFLRLTFFICKVMDLSLMHEKCHCSSAWHAEGMQRGPALIPPLLAITAFFPALSLPAPVVTCPGLQWGFSVPPHTLGPSFPVGKIRCHAL